MHIRKVLSDRILIMLERTMYLAIILLLVQTDFKITDLVVSIMQKYGQQIRVNRQQVTIYVYARFFANHCCAGKYINFLL